MNMWVAFLSKLARLADGLSHSQKARVISIALLGLSVIALGFGRPGENKPKLILPISLDQIHSITPDQPDVYIKVTGALDANRARQAEIALGPIILRGSRFLPMTSPGSAKELWVSDEDLPAEALSGQTVSLTGQLLEGGGDQPAIYLQAGLPPNVRLMNTIARVGLFVGAFILLAWLLITYIARRNFALGVSVPPTQNITAPEFLWFSPLGGELPAKISVTPREVVFENTEQTARWQAILRKTMAAQPRVIATTFGALPAARLIYENEVGLTRHATLAARSSAALNAALESITNY